MLMSRINVPLYRVAYAVFALHQGTLNAQQRLGGACFRARGRITVWHGRVSSSRRRLFFRIEHSPGVASMATGEIPRLRRDADAVIVMDCCADDGGCSSD